MYQFNPKDYGFVDIEAPLTDYWNVDCFVKITNHYEDSYWYTCCSKIDERWKFHSCLYSPKRKDPFCGGGHTIYIGCITSHEYAVQLLIHLLGTTTNEGTLKYGPKRLANIPDQEELPCI